MKLIAKRNVKYGLSGEIARPGEAFEIDDDQAASLIAVDAAVTPAEYEKWRLASEAADERVARLEAENATLRARVAGNT